MLLLINFHKIAERDLILNRVNLAIDVPHDLVAPAFRPELKRLMGEE